MRDVFSFNDKAVLDGVSKTGRNQNLVVGAMNSIVADYDGGSGTVAAIVHDRQRLLGSRNPTAQRAFVAWVLRQAGRC